VLTIRHTAHFRIEKPSILTIGTFDGVHLGHQKILKRLQELKEETGFQTVVLTFEPHPRKVLFPDQKDLKLLTLVDEKLALLKEYGVDITIVYPFDKAFASIEPESYISNILVKSAKVKQLVIGYDHKFGKNRGGDINVLRHYADFYQYKVEEIHALDVDSIAISSSKIRHALEAGNIELANSYLGHPYFFYAEVIHGKHLGKTIGYPTANLFVEGSEKLIPRIGVYFVEVVINSAKYFGMMNIGYNPTTDLDMNVKVEVHVFGFNENLYGQKIRVNLLCYLRDEKKFNGIDELTRALKEDEKLSLSLIDKFNTTIQ
jgi:riboflavin kinase / FMN adenylyltransferase